MLINPYSIRGFENLQARCPPNSLNGFLNLILIHRLTFERERPRVLHGMAAEVGNCVDVTLETKSTTYSRLRFVTCVPLRRW
jgi:hypothetical protein